MKKPRAYGRVAVALIRTGVDFGVAIHQQNHPRTSILCRNRLHDCRIVFNSQSPPSTIYPGHPFSAALASPASERRARVRDSCDRRNAVRSCACAHRNSSIPDAQERPSFTLAGDALHPTLRGKKGGVWIRDYLENFFALNTG